MIPELEEIKRVFLREWDPIGVCDKPGAADEYDGYAQLAFVMLNSGAGEDAIFRFLSSTVTEWIGLNGDPAVDSRIAKKLIHIHQCASGSD